MKKVNKSKLVLTISILIFIILFFEIKNKTNNKSAIIQQSKIEGKIKNENEDNCQILKKNNNDVLNNYDLNNFIFKRRETEYDNDTSYSKKKKSKSKKNKVKSKKENSESSLNISKETKPMEKLNKDNYVSKDSINYENNNNNKYDLNKKIDLGMGKILNSEKINSNDATNHNNDKIKYQVFDPKNLNKINTSNTFPDELKNLKKFKLNSKNISKFTLGFAAGYGLNTEVTKDLEECFNIKEKKENIENMITILSSDESTSDTKNDISENVQNTIISKIIGVFSFLNCSAFKKSILGFLKNKIIKWGINSLIYIATGPVGILVKYGYDTVKLAYEIKNFLNSLHSHPIDYTKSGSALGRVIYYLSDLLVRRKRK